jgi:HEAT repeat protein
MQFLVRLVQEKPRGEGADLDKQQIMDVRIAAARALGNFNDPATIQALQEVLKSEKDIALRDSAKDSIELASGIKKPWVDWQALENLILPASAKQTN